MKGVGSTVDGTLAAAQGTKGVTQVEMFDVWPSNISPIDLSQDAANTIETFQVTWQYNYLSHSNS
jgi:expansin (peptidoglycan-binding protein)